MGSSVKKVLKPLSKLAPILPFIPIPGMFGLSSLLTKSLITGALGGYGGKGGGFDLKRGLMSGLMSYGLGSLAQGAGAAGSTTGAPTSTLAGPSLENATFEPGVGYVNAAGNPIPDVNTLTPDFTGGEKVFLDSAGNPASSYAIPADGSAVPQAGGSAVAVSPQGAAPAPSMTEGFRTSLPAGSGPMDYLKQTGDNIMATGKGAYNLVTGAPGATEAFKGALPINPFTGKAIEASTLATGAGLGYAGVKTIDELQAKKNEADRILEDQENRRQEDIEYAKGILKMYPIEFRRLTGQDVSSQRLAQGGIAGLAYGGMAPRFLKGGGDGMSDSIPARIGGRQEARLADGEFVVPADVVSHIGNGSSNAGAKKLYAMMDRARQARTGRKRQAPAVKAERYMPA